MIIPKGWKLVPKVATDAMLERARRDWLGDPMRRSSTLWAAMLAAAPTAPAGEPECPRPMSTAPRDGTMVRLLVQFTNHGVNDGFDSGPAWTIGANTYDDSGDDEWFIAGWDWQQDCFTAGEGEPLGWLPMLSAPAPDEREMADAARDVLAERRRQVEGEGWTPEHDDEHENGKMAVAAGYYALVCGWPYSRPGSFGDFDQPPYWPWDQKWWKPTTPRRNLVKAGALILAEIERLDRLRAGKEGEPEKSPGNDTIDPDNPPQRYDASAHRMTRCQADDDGDCTWAGCPQLRDGEPKKSGRHCPWDRQPDEEHPND